MSNILKSILLLTLFSFLVACSDDDDDSSESYGNGEPVIQQVYKLTLAETWGENFPIFGDTTKRFARLVNEMSGGRLEVQVDSANKHKAALGIFDLVKSGQYDLGHSASYYWKGKDPDTLYFTTMPFGMTAWEQHAWFEYGGGQELMDEVYSKHGLKSVIGGNTGNQMGGWFQKQIKSTGDLQGLKMRIPGFAGEVMAKVGVKPTNIASGELYTALERGTIDALEWVGPSLDLRMGFHKIAPYYYHGWHEPGTELQFLINIEKMNSLPEDLQSILITAMKFSAYQMYADSTDKSAKNWATMQEDYPDIQVKSFPRSVLRALKQANKELLDEDASNSETAAKVINSQRDYLEQVRAWTAISEQAYLNSN